MQLDLFEYKKLINPPKIQEPKTDNDKLLNLQFDFLTKKDAESKNKYWLNVQSFVIIFMKTELKKKSKRLDKVTFEDRALDAVVYFFGLYENPDFFIKKSVITFIYGAVLNALNYKSRGQKVFENALRLSNTSSCNFDDALEIAKDELDKEESQKTGKLKKRIKHKIFMRRQLSLF